MREVFEIDRKIPRHHQKKAKKTKSFTDKYVTSMSIGVFRFVLAIFERRKENF